MKPFVDTCIRFFKKETVLCVAGILAFISAFFVHPSAAYIGYIDFRVLSLLFCLMLVVAGFQSIGLFHFLGSALLTKVRTTRQLILVLSLLCFFSSMFITNDVSLLTFVPFGIMILTMTGQQKLLISTIVLQTIGANLGSMFTPVGNPQNLYLASAFSVSTGTFLMRMLPLTALSLILLVAAACMLPSASVDGSCIFGKLPEPAQGGRKNLRNAGYCIYLWYGLFLYDGKLSGKKTSGFGY